MKHDADLSLMHPVRIGHRQDGHIYNDSVQTGNHPFRDGKWVDTSPIQKDEVIDGQRYLTTRSGTVYRVIALEYAPEKNPNLSEASV